MTDAGDSSPATAAGAVQSGRGQGGPGRRSHERAWVVAAVLVAVVATAGYAGWRRLVHPTDPRYQAVIDLLGHDPSALPAPDDHGSVALSGRFHGLTPRDQLYVVRKPDGLMLVMFPTFYGDGFQMIGLLYASRPLGDDDTYLRQPALGRARQAIDVAAYQRLYFDRRIDDHWFQVSYNMH